MIGIILLNIGIVLGILVLSVVLGFITGIILSIRCEDVEVFFGCMVGAIILGVFGTSVGIVVSIIGWGIYLL